MFPTLLASLLLLVPLLLLSPCSCCPSAVVGFPAVAGVPALDKVSADACKIKHFIPSDYDLLRQLGTDYKAGSIIPT
jgi:hypothetical protein